jgi:hypothetical protein
MSCGGGSERGPRCGCGARDAEAVTPASVVLLLRGVESKERARWLVGERWSDTPLIWFLLRLLHLYFPNFRPHFVVFRNMGIEEKIKIIITKYLYFKI